MRGRARVARWRARASAAAVGVGPEASAAERRMEGGDVDTRDRRLYSLQEYLEGKAPYVSVAADPSAFPYGTELRIHELEEHYGRRIVFRQHAEIHPGHVLDLAGGRDDTGAGAGGAEADDDGGEDEQPDAGGDDAVHLATRALPFVEYPAPHGAENDDARHVQGPAGEAEAPHLGLAHRVEEELEIPTRAGQRREEVIAEPRHFEIGRRGGDRLGCGVATVLATLPPEHHDMAIALLDQQTATLGRLITRPDPTTRAALALIRLRESDDVAALTAALLRVA